MKVVRPVQKKDLQALTDLACTMSLGVTSLPKKKSHLKEKIDRSVQAFRHLGKKKRDPQLFLFVLEDLENGELLGSSQIISQSGIDSDYYFYEVVSDPLQEVELLSPTKLVGGPSKLAGLYLHPQARKSGVGKTLSFCRFHLMADFEHSFSSEVIAVMRGVITKELTSPFWDAVGSHFCSKSFQKAMEKDSEQPDFHHKIIPYYPIYIDLLPKSAQEVISKTHPNTRAALHLLLDSGFHDSGLVDPYDAGPVISARRKELHLIRSSSTTTVDKIVPKVSASPLMISTRSKEHRTAVAPCIVKKRGVTLTTETAKALQVNVGDSLRISSLL